MIQVGDGSGTGTFEEIVSGLNPSTDYHFQAYATNSAGTSYGGVESFTTLASYLESFSWSADNLAAGATGVTYTFNYEIVTAKPTSLLYAINNNGWELPFLGLSGNGYYITDLEKEDVTIKINNVEIDRVDFGVRNWNKSLIDIRLVDPTLPSGSQVEIIIENVTNKNEGSSAWTWIRTATSGGHELDGAANPDPIVLGPPSATGAITITNDPSDSSSDWQLSGGKLIPLVDGAKVNVTEVTNALASGDVIIEAETDVFIDATVAPSLAAARNLTLQGGGNVILRPGSEITAIGNALNLVLWADADGNDDGVVWSDWNTTSQGASIHTNGGHLWMGGGAGSTTWNGLTVGDGLARGNATNSNGITLVKADIQTSGGNLAFYGRGRTGAAAGISIPANESGTSSDTGYNINGIRILGGTQINAGTGTVYMYGYADATSGNANGIEMSQAPGGPGLITNANTTEQAIILEGYAENNPLASNSWGVYTHYSTVQNTADGTIHIKGGGSKNSGVTVAADGAVLSQSGKIILEGTASGDTNPEVLILGAVGQKTGSSITASSAAIEIIGDKLHISGSTPNGLVASSGSLAIKPLSPGTNIGIGGTTGTLLLPATMFNTHIEDGFSEITIGDERAGLITVEGTLVYQDPLTFKTNGSIVFASNANVSSIAANAFTLWSRASGDNPANDTNYGTIWLMQGASINTNGGDVTMGGGADPTLGFAFGDTSVPSNAENNARTRGVAMNGAVNADGGNIIINGKASNTVTHARGVNIAGPVQTAGSGEITINGIAQGSSDGIALGDSYFTPDAIGILESGTGTISLDGIPSGVTRNGLNISTAGSYIKTGGNFSAVTTGRLTATAGALEIEGNTNLEAADNIALTHASNDFGGSLTVISAANLQVTDQNELTLGGISASGAIEIASLGGDLSITDDISTTNTSADAIILNAGQSESIGTETGGNIIVSGTPVVSTGTSGIAKLFSGSEPASTGLTDLVGGLANVRKEVDETTTTFDPVLEAGNAYALYRYQDIIQLTVDSQDLTTSKTYDGTNSAAVTDIVPSGVRPGDEVTITGEATYDNATTGSAKTITVVYTLGGADAAGYLAPENRVVTTGEILAKELTISGLTGDNKVYDGNTTATLNGTAELNGVETGDDVALGGTPALIFTSANVGPEIAITASGYTISGPDAGNYTLAQPTGLSAAITPRPLEITADSNTKVYDGTALTDNGYSITSGELVSGHLVITMLVDGSQTNVGTSANTIVLAEIIDALEVNAKPNYDITYVNGILEVTPAPLTITADNQSKVYGEENPGLTFTYTGLVNGDTEVSDEPGISTTATESSNVGTYPVTLTGGSDANYDISLVAGELEVTQAALTITADDKSKVYGEANPALTYTYTGLVNGDTEVSEEPGISTTATSSSNVGTYPVTLTVGSDANYDISLVAGELEITQASLTITADDKSKVYGEENPALTFTYTGLVNGDTQVSEEPGISTTATASSNVGTYPVTLTGGSDANYDISLVAGELEVTQAALTVTADDKSKVYGEANPSLTFTYTGLVNGDTEVSEEPGISTTATASSNVGTYPVTLTGGSDANYDISLVAGELEITQAALTITADDKSKVYGEANPSLTFTYTGLVNGDTEISVLPEITTNVTLETGAGVYPISLSGAEDSNYQIKMMDGILEVTPKTLEVKANSGLFKTFGDTDPEFTYLASGFEGKDDYEVFSGQLERELGESPGTYTINQGSLVAGKNYKVRFTGNQFEIIEIVVVDVLEIAPVHMAWGEDIPELPTTVLVITDRDEIINLPVTWDDASVEVLASGSYTLTGSLDLGSVHENPENQQAKLTLVVDPKQAPVNLLITNNEFEGEEANAVVQIGELEVIDAVDDIHYLELPEGLYDNGYFEISSGQLHWNSPERAEGITTFQVLVRVTDRDGNVMDRLLEIERTRKSVSEIEVYNSFTPNGDGINDGWGVPDLRHYSGVSIQVFERSGKRVFYTQDPDRRWDGTFEGVDLPIGTYYWTVQVKETGETRKGMLNILKK